MLIVLPPSEGKHRPVRGKPLDPGGLTAADVLTSPRTQVRDALVELCQGPADEALTALRLPPTMVEHVAENAALPQAATAPAGSVYTGVLYRALDLGSLSGTELRRANARVLVMSALFGVVGLRDRIPAYRLSGSVRLPSVGPVARFWREPLAQVIPALARGRLIVDLRSAPYHAMWQPTSDDDVVTVKVWQQTCGGDRIAVSHHNKATKGLLARILATTSPAPRDAADAAAVLAGHGWQVLVNDTGPVPQLDVLLTDAAVELCRVPG